VKKLIMSVILSVTLVVGVGVGTPALATTVGGTGGTTQMGVHIIGNPQQQRLADLVDQIPSGQTPTTGADGDRLTGSQPTASKKTGSKTGNKQTVPGAVVTAVKSGSADLVAGRLPQTSESQLFLVSLFGMLLLMVVVLAMLVYQQARRIRERN